MSEPMPLEEKFPDMKPVRSAPSLITSHGVGTTVYGRRDYDADTNTYVKTHCVCFLFVPLLALGAYRVADAPAGGWYFIGRVPLSTLARAWNYLILLVILAGGGALGWHLYTTSADYVAGQKIVEADELAAAGKLTRAAQVLRPIAQGDTSHAYDAQQKLGQLLDTPQAAPAELAGAFQVAVELQRSGQTIDRLIERGVEQVTKHAASPRGALQILDVIARFAQENPQPQAKGLADVPNVRLALLEKILAKEPGDLDAISDAAVIYESRRDLAKCEKLLAPHAAKLSTREGARILGQILAGQGKFDEAHALLAPYAEERLKRLHDANQTLRDTLQQVENDNLQELRQGRAPGFDYTAYKAADKDTQDKMVNDYLDERLRKDPSVLTAQLAIRRESQAVPVALDLGIVLLRRAQSMPDPEERKKELQKAEKTFLSVRGVGGPNEEVNLFLGQVYYWLGKHAEGKKLWDELMVAQNRTASILVTVAHMLREVGEQSQARVLAEEAYEKAPVPEDRFRAAAILAVIAEENDDRVLWLKRCNPADKQAQAQLHEALGEQATLESKDDEAANNFRQAIDLFAALPENPATLNNGALAHLNLYRVTGDAAILEKAYAMIDKAVTLRQSDSVLVLNAGGMILVNSLADVVGKELNVRALKRHAHLDLLAFLYNDDAQAKKYRQHVQSHPGVVKGAGKNKVVNFYVGARGCSSTRRGISLESG